MGGTLFLVVNLIIIVKMNVIMMKIGYSTVYL